MSPSVIHYNSSELLRWAWARDSSLYIIWAFAGCRTLPISPSLTFVLLYSLRAHRSSVLNGWAWASSKLQSNASQFDGPRPQLGSHCYTLGRLEGAEHSTVPSDCL